QCDDDVWGSTNEETNTDKNEDYDEDDDNEEEDDEDESVNEEENTVAETEEEETANSEHEEDDTKGEDQKTEEEPKGDDQAKEAEVGVHDLVKIKEKSEFLQSTSIKVSVIPKPTQQPPSTLPLPAIKDPAAPVINFKAINSFLYKFHALEKDIQELKQVDPSAAILDSIRSQSHTARLKKELTVKKAEYKEFIEESVTNEVKNQLSKILIKAVSDFATLTKTSLNHMLKRNREEDKDEDPLAGPNQDKETKKRRTGKEAESSKKSSTPKESTKGKPLSKSSKTGKSAPTDQSLKEHEHEIPEPDWNTVKTIDDAPKQPWFNEIINAEKPPLTFNELMSKTIDLSAYAMNRLKLTKLTREVLVGPVFNLLKGTCKSCVELEYNMEECFRALTDQLDWKNPKGYDRPVDMSKPLSLQEKEGRLIIPIEVFYNNDLEYLKRDKAERTYLSSNTMTPTARYTMEWIEDLIPNLWIPILIDYDKDAALGIKHRRPQRQQFYRAMINKTSTHNRADNQLYKFKEGDFPDLHLNEIEDMLLLLTQNRLFNLEGNFIIDLGVALRMFTRSIILQSRVEDVQLGVKSYQWKLNFSKP
ncbi:hypothetical protein Tco_1035806, partial [Tanacetum coccineum]